VKTKTNVNFFIVIFIIKNRKVGGYLPQPQLPCFCVQEDCPHDPAFSQPQAGCPKPPQVDPEVTTTGADASAFFGVLYRNAPAIITVVVSPRAVIVFVIRKIKIRKILVITTSEIISRMNLVQEDNAFLCSQW